MLEKQYTEVMILEKLKDYFKYRLELEKNKDNLMIFYSNDFWFLARNKKTMDKIATIGLDEILKSCNDIKCDDAIFDNKEDLLNELNSLVPNNNIIEYIKFFLEEVYGASVYEDSI